VKKRPLFLQFGAGNIGRSLVGAVFSRAGYDVTFADTSDVLVDALRERGEYKVVVKGDLPPGRADEILVKPVTAFNSGSDPAALEKAVQRADLIGTSVGASGIPHVIRAIAPLLAKRERPVSILLCENLHGVDKIARRLLEELLPPGFPIAGRIGLVSTSIGKMVPLMPAHVRERDPLEVWGEAYDTIIADRNAFVGPVPEIEGLELRGNFAAYVDRKLYIHNLGHAVCACLGAQRGYMYICDAIEDPVIFKTTRDAMMSTAFALMKRYPGEFTEESQTEYVEDLLRRFRNRALGDTVFRVGRDLKRKLADGDRFIGGLRLVKEAGGDTRPICQGIAAALRFNAADDRGKPYPTDGDVLNRVRAIGPTLFLREYCKLDPTEFRPELREVDTAYRAVQA
jgi:mannitol-1-phosphate 5-dehydrogenase